MYAFIKGTLAAAAENYAVIECGGIGYKVYAPRRFLEQAKLNAPAKLYTHLVVKEDELSLYGFETDSGREMFERLIGISGIGPKAGLSILSQMTPDEVARAIFAGDAKAFSKAPGIGKKTAERIVLELKDKMDIKSALQAEPGQMQTVSSALEEAAEALTSLGYQKAEAVAAVRGVASLADTAEELILLALKRLDVR